MIAMLIAFFIAFLSYNFFMMSYQINGINRLVTSAPLSLFETAIDMFDVDVNKGPYFDKEILEVNINTFFGFFNENFFNSVPFFAVRNNEEFNEDKLFSLF